jgi:hypothetical protein
MADKHQQDGDTAGCIDELVLRFGSRAFCHHSSSLRAVGWSTAKEAARNMRHLNQN